MESKSLIMIISIQHPKDQNVFVKEDAAHKMKYQPRYDRLN